MSNINLERYQEVHAPRTMSLEEFKDTFNVERREAINAVRKATYYANKAKKEAKNLEHCTQCHAAKWDENKVYDHGNPYQLEPSWWCRKTREECRLQYPDAKQCAKEFNL